MRTSISCDVIVAGQQPDQEPATPSVPDAQEPDTEAETPDIKPETKSKRTRRP